MRHLTIVMAAALNLSVASTAQAARPLNTDDAPTVGQGEIELEVAYEYIHATDTENNLGAVVTAGVLPHLDVGVEIPYQFLDFDEAAHHSGLADIAIAAKWNFLRNEHAHYDAAIAASYKFDNGDAEEGLGTGRPEYSVLAIISKSLQPFSLHLNVGPSFEENGDESLNYGLAGAWEISETLTFMGELYGGHVFETDFDNNSLSVAIGAAAVLNEATAFDIGVSAGIAEDSPDFGVTTGLTITL